MKKIFQDKKGFTLVELLVVISIIAILSVVGLTLFNGAQANARDARRKSDIDAIAAALEAKKQPGAAFYSLIGDADFSSGSIPVDSTTNKYCIKTYAADDGARTDTVDPGLWNATADGAGGGSVCPTGYSLVSTANALKANGIFTDGAAGTPALNKKSWKACAKLENTTATPAYYCKNSAQ